MKLARQNNDHAELAALAHWLKGSGGTVGFDQFYAPAKALEESAKAGDQSAIDQYLDVITELGPRISCLLYTSPSPRDS